MTLQGRDRRTPPGRRQGGRPVGRSRPAPAAGAAARRWAGRSTSSAGATSRPRTSARRPSTWTRSRESPRGSPASTSRAGARATRRRSPRSAWSCAMRAAVRRARRRSDLRGRRVVVQGAGHVGVAPRRASSSKRRASSSVTMSIRARVDALAHASSASGPSRPTTRSSDAVRHARAVRARWRARRRDDRAAALPRGRGRGEQPARTTRVGRAARRRATCCTCPTSWPAPAASSTSPRSSPATTAHVRSSARPGSRSRRPACSTPRRARRHAARAAEELAATASPTKAPADAGNPATPPPGPTAPRSPGCARAIPDRTGVLVVPLTLSTPFGSAFSACCRCGRGSSGRAGATR